MRALQRYLGDSEKVSLLLKSAHDYVPAPKGSRLFLEAESGAGASKFMLCTLCKGCRRQVNGSEPCVLCLSRWRERQPIQRPRHGCRVCLACDIHGMVRAKRSAQQYDPYTGLTMSELETALSKSPRRAHHNGTGDGNSELPWLLERDRYRRAGSYGDLDKALEWLKTVAPNRHQLVTQWSVTHTSVRWSSSSLRHVVVTVEIIAARMPTPIRVPRWVITEYGDRLSPAGGDTKRQAPHGVRSRLAEAA